MADHLMPEEFRILIVDDDRVDRMVVRRALRSASLQVQVEEVEDVPTALERLVDGAFDCVFLDYQLPGGDGLRVLRGAREKGVTTPIVMLTGQGDDQVAVELMKAGATDYLTKSKVGPERLAQVLRHAVRVRRAEEQARRAEEERERAIAARNRFYAAMSHELRTPINAILGYTDLLLTGVYGPLNEPQLAGMQRAHRAAHHLLELVNDVLDLSKLEAGKADLQPETVAIPQLVEDLFTTVRPMAEARGTELRLDVERCGRPIVTDPRRVRQILLNLLSNAIKFGEGRPVCVRCAAGDDGGVAIEVVDQGVGIAPEDLPRVFEEFVQLSTEEAHGTGLGLPISRRFAELLDGALTAESRPGEGSTFRLTLPPVAPAGR